MNTKNKPLSEKCIKELLSLNYDEKVRLYARLKMFGQNKKISGIICSTVPKEYLAQTKYEITHLLYDGNNSDKYKNRFYELSKKMREKGGATQFFDTYTMCAYSIYFSKFIEYAESAKNYYDLCEAKTNALTYVRKNCDFDRDRLCLDYDEKEPDIHLLLNSNYRDSAIKYLARDLDVKNSFEFLKCNMQEDYDHEFEEQLMEEFETTSNSIYANNVEEYRDEKGKVCYIDAEGNTYDYDEIADFNYNGYSLSATKDGFKVSQNNKKDEFTK